MVDLRFRINFGSGFVDVDPPRNWPDMKVKVVLDNSVNRLQLESIIFEWDTKNARLLKDYYDRGMLGGTGILEGPGLEIDGSLPGFTPLNFFKGCINTANRGFNLQDDIIFCPIREAGRNDELHDRFDSFWFERLTTLAPGTPGFLSRIDYKQTPYAVSSIPDYTQAMLLSISLFIIVKESVDVVAKIASLITRAISQSLSWLQLIGTIIEIILYLIYLVAILVASAKLIQEIADNLLQPKKTKLCMTELDLWKKACAYLGYSFVSPIYGEGTADLYGKYRGATLMPTKQTIPQGDPADEIFSRPEDETTSTEAYGYYDEGTALSFMQKMELKYSAEALLINGTVYFQDKNLIDISDAFELPNEGVVGNTFLYPQPFGTNASEISAVYGIRFQKDQVDLNTIKDYKGTFILVETIPNIYTDKANVLLTGQTMIDIPFALARRKVGFTKLEKALLELLDTFATFINGIGDSVDHINGQLSSWLPNIIANEDTGLSNTQIGTTVGFLTGQPVFSVLSIILGSDGLPIFPSVTIPYFSNDRIGWMLLSSDYIGVMKNFIGIQNGDDWYIHPNNEEGLFVQLNPGLNGIFTGTIIGAFAWFGGSGQPFTGTVVNGILTGSSTTTIPGNAAGVVGIVNGTISGQSGTFTASIIGSITIGTFNGVGVIGPGSGPSTYTSTQGWGGAPSLWYDFHFRNGIEENQWLTFDNKKFKFGMNNFIQITEKNVLKSPSGEYGKFLEMLWVLHNDLVQDVNYRIKHKYTNNYQLKITTDNG